MGIASLIVAIAALAGEAATFANPVAQRGADPWVVRDGEMYHYCYATRNRTVWIASAPTLLGVFSAKAIPAWRPEPGHIWSRELWAPELHQFNGMWYIYVAADDGDNKNHRMQVLRRVDPDPAGVFERLGQLQLPDDKWAIDGTLFPFGDKLYFIWSGWPGDEDVTQRLYICAMADPVTPVGSRFEISQPDHDWEQVGKPTVNEGPEILAHDGRTFLVYSASGSWGDHYCLGMLELTGKNPLDPHAWTKAAAPVFAGANGIVSPGHASFVAVGDDHWIIYHSARRPGAGWDRVVNVQPFKFDAQGRPEFGSPVPWGRQLPQPADVATARAP